MTSQRLFAALTVFCALVILLISTWGIARSTDARTASSGEIAAGHKLLDVEQVGMDQLRDVLSIASPPGASEMYAIDCLREDSLFLRIFLGGGQLTGQLSLVEVWNSGKISFALMVESLDLGGTQVYVFGRSSESGILRMERLPQNGLPLILRVLITSDEVQVQSVVSGTVAILPLSPRNQCGELVIAPGESPEVLDKAERIPEFSIDVTFGYLDKRLIQRQRD